MADQGPSLQRHQPDAEPTLDELHRRVEDAILDYMLALPENERVAFAERARELATRIYIKGLASNDA